MTSLKRRANSLPVAPVIAAMFAAVAVALVLAMPHWLFEYYVQRAGLPQVLPAAAPPLGGTARIGAAIAAGLASFAGLWAGLRSIELRFVKPARSNAAAGSIVPAAPPPPVSAATELGAPLMSEEAMTQAREELILDAAMIEEAPEAEAAEVVPVAEAIPEPLEAEVAEIVPEIVEPVVAAPPPTTPVARLPVTPDSLAALLHRLDSALLDKPIGWKPQPARMRA